MRKNPPLEEERFGSKSKEFLRYDLPRELIGIENMNRIEWGKKQDETNQGSRLCPSQPQTARRSRPLAWQVYRASEDTRLPSHM